LLVQELKLHQMQMDRVGVIGQVDDLPEFCRADPREFGKPVNAPIRFETENRSSSFLALAIPSGVV
jgi:hypothetical protein